MEEKNRKAKETRPEKETGSLSNERRAGNEEKKRRGEYVKHYDLGGGRHQMVIYPEPVHYQKDGKWEEIDNRLREVEENGRRVWRNGESPLSVELARYADDGALVRLESEGQGLSWRFQEQQASCEAQVLGGEEELGLREQ